MPTPQEGPGGSYKEYAESVQFGKVRLGFLSVEMITALAFFIIGCLVASGTIKPNALGKLEQAFKSSAGTGAIIGISALGIFCGCLNLKRAHKWHKIAAQP